MCSKTIVTTNLPWYLNCGYWYGNTNNTQSVKKHGHNTFTLTQLWLIFLYAYTLLRTLHENVNSKLALNLHTNALTFRNAILNRKTLHWPIFVVYAWKWVLLLDLNRVFWWWPASRTRVFAPLSPPSVTAVYRGKTASATNTTPHVYCPFALPQNTPAIHVCFSYSTVPPMYSLAQLLVQLILVREARTCSRGHVFPSRSRTRFEN